MTPSPQTLSPADHCKIAMECVGSVMGMLPPRSCEWYALKDALDELDQALLVLDEVAEK